MNARSGLSPARKVRVLGIQGDTNLERFLRGAGRSLGAEAIGVAWPRSSGTPFPGSESARTRALLTIMPAGDKLFLTNNPTEIKAYTGLASTGSTALAAVWIAPLGAALFAIGPFGRDTRSLLLALRDLASATGALVAQRAAQQRLNICQSQLEHAERLSRMGHWCYDVATRRYELSPMACALHDLPADLRTADLRTAFANVAVDDVTLIEQTFAQLQAAPTESFSCEYRVVGAGGQHLRISTIIGGRTDETGALVTVTGACRDVSNDYRMREALELSEAHFRRLAETCNDIIVCYAPTGEVTYASPAVEPVLGYAPEELVGQNIEHIMVERDRAPAIERFRACVRGRLADTGETYSYEVIRKDGKRIWLESRPRAVADPTTGRTVEVRDSLRDITVRMKVEEAVIEQQRYIQLLTDGSTDLITRFGLDGSIQYISPASQSIIGLSPEELAGRKTWEFIHRDDHKHVRAAFQAILDAPGKVHPRFQYRLVQPNGTIRHVEANPSPIEDQLTGEITQFFDVTRDVTERHVADLQLKAALEKAETAIQSAGRSEARYRLLADTARDLTIQYDHHGVIRYASPSSSHLGYAPSDLIGRRIEDFVHPDDLDKALSAARTNFSLPPGETPSAAEMRVLTKAGDYVWLEGNPAVVRDLNGRVVIVNSTLRDITERRKLVDNLVEARLQAEAATAAKSAFLANMSHELRTPLTSVLGFSQQILAQPDLPRNVQHAADRIAAGGRALLTTINDILDFSKIENGDIRLSPQSTAVDSVVAEVAELLRLGAEQKGVTLEAWGDATLPQYVLIDPDRLRQILLNLTGNAIKFTERGSVDLLVYYRAEDERLRIEVKDTGVGISPEHASKLFKRFSQVDDTITRKYGGTGLGLAISKGLVEAMGGEIGVVSEVGLGSTFWFEVSASPAEPPLVETRSCISLPPGVRILLVDDHSENLEVLSTVLAAAGACAWKSNSPSEALELAMAGRFDAIITDRRMPDIDGPELARRIRAKPGPNRFAPILLCTADHGSLVPTESSLFDGVLIKPVAPLELVSRIAAAIAEDNSPMSTPTDLEGSSARCDACVGGLAKIGSLVAGGPRCSGQEAIRGCG